MNVKLVLEIIEIVVMAAKNSKMSTTKKQKLSLPAGTKVCAWASCLMREEDEDMKAHMQYCGAYMRIRCNYCPKRCLAGQEAEMVMHLNKRHLEQMRYVSGDQAGYTIDERPASAILEEAVHNGVVTIPVPPALPAPEFTIPKLGKDEKKSCSETVPDDYVALNEEDDLDDGEIHSDGDESATSWNQATRDETVEMTSAEMWRKLAEERRATVECLRATIATQRALINNMMSAGKWAGVDVAKATVSVESKPLELTNTSSSEICKTPGARLDKTSMGGVKAKSEMVSKNTSSGTVSKASGVIKTPQREVTVASESEAGRSADLPEVGILVQSVVQALQAAGAAPHSFRRRGRGGRGAARFGRDGDGPFRCHECGGVGHRAVECPNQRRQQHP